MRTPLIDQFSINIKEAVPVMKTAAYDSNKLLGPGGTLDSIFAGEVEASQDSQAV